MTDDGKTPLQCRACGGYATGCRFCRDPKTGESTGFMTDEQLITWQKLKSGSRPAFNPADVKDRSITPLLDTMPFNTHRALILEQLAKSWDNAPSMRLGELIAKALVFAEAKAGDLETIPDRELCELIRAYLLLAGPSK